MRAVWSAPEAGRAHEAEACLRPYTHSKLAGGFEGIANLCRSLADLGGETAHFDRKFGPFEFSGALRDLVGTRSSTDFGFFFGGFFISFLRTAFVCVTAGALHRNVFWQGAAMQGAKCFRLKRY